MWHAGLSVKPPLGRGELNAALGGMGAIVGMTSPLIWGRLFRFFSSTGHGSWWCVLERRRRCRPVSLRCPLCCVCTTCTPKYALLCDVLNHC